MLQIRHSLFETNSSSCHVLVVPMNQDIIFSKIACSDGLDYLLDHAYGIEGLIHWLYEEGVEEIIYNGNDSSIRRTINEVKYAPDKRYDFRVGLDNAYLSKEVLKMIIFGDETMVDIRDDSHPIENDNEMVFLGHRIGE